MTKENKFSCNKQIFRILTINRCNSDNLGDQAIGRSLKKLLELEGYKVTSFDLVSVDLLQHSLREKPSQTKKRVYKRLIGVLKRSSFFSHVLLLTRSLQWFFRNFRKIRNIATKNFDIAFIGGGQLILSGGLFPIALFTWVLFLKNSKTEIFLLGVGAGKTYNWYEKILYKKALSFCQEIYLRDNDSIETIKETFGFQPMFIPDLAFCYSLCTSKKDIRYINRDSLIVGIVDYKVYLRYRKEMDFKWLSENDYILLWKKQVIELINKVQPKNLILTSTTKADLYYSSMLYRTLLEERLTCKIEFVSELLSLEEYYNLLRRGKTIISGRMHALILAQTLGVEVIPWPISRKIVSYEREYNGTDVRVTQKTIQSTIHSILCRSGRKS